MYIWPCIHICIYIYAYKHMPIRPGRYGRPCGGLGAGQRARRGARLVRGPVTDGAPMESQRVPLYTYIYMIYIYSHIYIYIYTIYITFIYIVCVCIKMCIDLRSIQGDGLFGLLFAIILQTFGVQVVPVWKCPRDASL